MRTTEDAGLPPTHHHVVNVFFKTEMRLRNPSGANNMDPFVFSTARCFAFASFFCSSGRRYRLHCTTDNATQLASSCSWPQASLTSRAKPVTDGHGVYSIALLMHCYTTACPVAEQDLVVGLRITVTTDVAQFITLHGEGPFPVTYRTTTCPLHPPWRCDGTCDCARSTCT